ncbi:l1 transposable element-related [Holotrichia oblita]|uniref:L1 transposable element-related n=1 Tax=Holotrichia oblita TaxID=644536 RepID=A0ACB9SSX1_HOLOL|nr:l1 transposable element-related [Holotrichia oblita]
MPTDRVLRDDALITKIVEQVLKSDSLLEKISQVIGEKTAAIIKAYEQKVVSLEVKLAKAYEDIDSLEQYSRLNNLRLYGIPETPNENTDVMVASICKDKLGITIPPESIDCSHRLGKVENGHRPIVVKFCVRNIKQSIYNNKRKLKNTKIVIREDLTKQRLALMKDVKKRLGVAWTNHCKIFTKVGNRIYNVKTTSDLDNLTTVK